VEVAEGYWTAVFAKRTACKEQSYAFVENKKALEESINKHWKEGYNIQSLEFGNNQWFALFCKHDTFRKETYVISKKYSLLQKQVQEYWKKGYHIIDLAEGRQ
jgi:predicted GNAT superfamily acetyltransferase